MSDPIPNTQDMLAWQQVRNQLPVLQRRASQLRQRLQELNGQLTEQRRTVAGEQADVDRLQGRTLGNYLLQLSRQMDKRQQKEEEELIQARRKLDELIQEKEYQQQELAGLESRILDAQSADRLWQEGLLARKSWLENPLNAAAAAAYRQLQEQLRQEQEQLTEIGQAVDAARRAGATAMEMDGQLESADNWGTYDVWVKGGIISHMAKYDHIDTANAMMNQLTSQLRDLRRELADIRMSADFSLNAYSSGSRAFDFFFDNIFTDLSVRDRIREDRDTVREIRGQLNQLEQTLNGRLAACQAEVRRLQAEQERILVTMII